MNFAHYNAFSLYESLQPYRRKNTHRHIRATRHTMPKYFRDSRIEYVLQWGASNELCSRACARSLGFLMGYTERKSLTVPDGPVIVPIHRNKLSPSGNADIPLSPDICQWKQTLHFTRRPSELDLRLTKEFTSCQYGSTWYAVISSSRSRTTNPDNFTYLVFRTESVDSFAVPRIRS